MFVKSASFEIRGRDETCYTFAAELFEWVIETKPQEFPTKPTTAWYGCDVHGDVGLVVVFIQNPCNEIASIVHQPYCNSATGAPLPACDFTNPWADNGILPSNHTLQSTPPSS